MLDPPDDVPSSIDLQDPVDAATWVREADIKRPWRAQLRAAFADVLAAAHPPVRRVLELGSGPGLLAEQLLQACAVDTYVLFDFSPPMLALSRDRVGAHTAARFVLGDFTRPDWAATLDAPFDAVIAMQSVHEIRHKRRVPGLYRQLHDLLRPGGLLLVCDHVPMHDSPRATSLHSTEPEQLAALVDAGFIGAAIRTCIRGLYLCGGQRPT